MRLFIGTSGWGYDWNNDRSIEWYRNNTVFNAIELNFSFYKFPTEKDVRTWRNFRELSWSVKMNRLVTQNLKLNEKSDKFIRDFINVFKKGGLLPDNILFQLPPSFSADNMDRILRIGTKFEKYKPVFELRHKSFFNEDTVKIFTSNSITVASTDSPLGKFYVNTSGEVYMRFHGRGEWYDYSYSIKELSDALIKLSRLKSKKMYVFFNNIYMFKNANTFISTVVKKYGNILRYK
jgi:uncharacterized protein YecE (DUF72 family)